MPPAEATGKRLFESLPQISQHITSVIGVVVGLLSDVKADLVLQGYAVVPRSAYKLMAKSALRPDTLMFNLIDGVVTTRVRKSPDDTYVQPVDSLLAELGSDDRITLVRAATA